LFCLSKVAIRASSCRFSSGRSDDCVGTVVSFFMLDLSHVAQYFLQSFLLMTSCQVSIDSLCWGDWYSCTTSILVVHPCGTWPVVAAFLWGP
jgi:hypothetical protein